MPTYKDQFGSTLKVEDIQAKGQVRVVIEAVNVEDVKNDEGKERKLVARFIGKEKGLVLNRTNADKLAELAGSDDYDQWAGTPCILYVDPSVTFGGKRVGGIRIRGVNGGRPAQVELPPERPTPVDPPVPITDDDIPF